MGTFMLIIAVIVAKVPPNPNATSITSTGVAAIAMVYAEAASYNLSWGPVAWYVEILFLESVKWPCGRYVFLWKFAHIRRFSQAASSLA